MHLVVWFYLSKKNEFFSINCFFFFFFFLSTSFWCFYIALLAAFLASICMRNSFYLVFHSFFLNIKKPSSLVRFYFSILPSFISMCTRVAISSSFLFFFCCAEVALKAAKFSFYVILRCNCDDRTITLWVHRQGRRIQTNYESTCAICIHVPLANRIFFHHTW